MFRTWFPDASLRILGGFLILAASVVLAVPPSAVSAAAPSEVAGIAWRDINADGIRDASEPVFEGASVTLFDVDNGVVHAGPVTTAANGSYSFASLPDGNYRVDVTAPQNYWISPSTADNQIVPAGAGGTADKTGSSAVVAVSSSAGPDIDIAVRPRPELNLGQFGPGVLDGGPTFNTSGNCITPVAAPTPSGAPEWSDTGAPGQVPGDDCGSQNGVVRTQDSLVTIWSVTADNYEPGAGDLDAVIFEQILRPDADAVVDFARIPLSCIPAPDGSGGATPPSTITYDDPNPGDVKLTCNLGVFPEGFQESLTTFIDVSGESLNGSTFTTEQRVYSVDVSGNENAVPDDADPIGPVEISAAPAYDLEKDTIGILNYGSTTRDMAHDDHLPSCDTNPAPCNIGPEKGLYGYFIIGLSSEQQTGIEALAQPFSLDDDFFATTDTPSPGTSYPFEYEIMHCLPNTSGWGNTVLGYWTSNSSSVWYGSAVQDSGDCTPNRANPNDPTSSYEFEIDNADLSGTAYPDHRYGGADLTAGPFYVMMHRVAFFIPNRSIDLSDGATDGVGAISVSNCIDDFDPVSVSGVSNYGDLTEPGYNRSEMPDGTGSNNCAGPTTFQMTTTGGFSKYNYGYIGTNGYPYQNSGNSSHSGAHTYEPGQIFPAVIWNNNSGTNDLFDPVACDVFDNTTLQLAPAESVGQSGWTPPYLAAGSYAYVNNGYTWNANNDPADFVVEYASADFGSDDPIVNGFNPTTGRWEGDWSIARQFRCDDNATVVDGATTHQLLDPGAAADSDGDRWITDPTQFPNGIDDVNMVRARLADPTIALEAGDRLKLVVPLELRSDFSGGPHDGTEIPAGTVMPNFGGARWDHYAPEAWTARNYQPSPETTHADGDRVTLTRAQLRIQKHTLSPVTAVGENGSTLAGNQIVWELLPTLTSSLAAPADADNLTVVDVLPAEVSYNSSCTSTHPDGTPPDLVEPNQPNPGETRLTWFLGTWTPNTPITPRVICTDSDPLAPNGTAAVNSTSVSADGVTYDSAAQTDDHTIVLEQVGSLQLAKAVDLTLDDLNDDQVYTIAWTNFAPSFAVDAPVIIDVFSYDDDAGNNHDGPGSLSERDPASNFTGDFFLTGAPSVTWSDGSVPTGAEAPIGVWSYSADDPWTILDDPDANTSNWCEFTDFGTATCPTGFDDVTAIRFDSNYALDRDGNPRQGVVAMYTMQAGDPAAIPDPAKANEPGDIYTNRFSLDSTSLEADQYLRSNNVSVEVAAYSIGDLIFSDVNGNGSFDAGLDQPAPDGVFVELRDSSDDSLVDTFTTDSATLGVGRYLFEPLSSGDFYVTLPASNFTGTGSLVGWVPTVIPSGALEGDDANETVDQHGYTVGTVTADGLRTNGLVLSATPPLPGGVPIGNEPLGDNSGGITDPTNDDFSNLTLDLGLVAPADIEIQKEICNQEPVSGCDVDNDAHWVETFEVEYYEAAQWRITVENTGAQVLTDVVVNDPLEAACDRDSGDIAALALMIPGDSVSYTCDTSQVLVGFTNIADATGTPVTGPDPTDNDPAEVTLGSAAPGIDIEKSTNTIDADVAPGVYVPTGDTVVWTYIVTNPGNMPMRNVTVVDDMGTVSPADDVTMTKTSAEYVSGDLDNDDVLDLDETWTFEQSGTATAGQYTNVAEVTGTPVLGGLPDVTADDPSNYYGVDTPAIDVEKATNAIDPSAPTSQQDADAAPGVAVPVGSTVTWTYIVNTGGSNVPLSNVTIVDDNGTPGLPADDITPTYISGDDGDSVLEPGENWLYTASGTAIVGGYGNNVDVSGTAPDTTAEDGTTTPGATPSDDDPSHYTGSTWDIDIVKFVNGEDANEAPGPLLDAGSDASWTYEVTNIGEMPLVDIVVVDDQGVTVTCPGTTLLAGASMTCDGAAQPAVAGLYTNIGTVTGQPADDDLMPIIDPTSGAPIDTLTADDPANYFGVDVSYTLEKLVCDPVVNPNCDPDMVNGWVDDVTVLETEDVVWLIEVVVTGNASLDNVVIDDPVESNCDRNLGTLEPGESVRFTCEGELGSGTEVTNVAFLTGDIRCDLPAGAGGLVTVDLGPDNCSGPTDASDPATARKPATMTIDKTVDDATPIVGQEVIFTITVVNDGGTTAESVEIVDNMPASISYLGVLSGNGNEVVHNPTTNVLTWTIPALAPGESAVLEYRTSILTATTDENVATITLRSREVVLGNGVDTQTFTSTGRTGTLAFTGAGTLGFVMSSAALMMAGGGLLLIARRRRFANCRLD